MILPVGSVLPKLNAVIRDRYLPSFALKRLRLMLLEIWQVEESLCPCLVFGDQISCLPLDNGLLVFGIIFLSGK